MVFNPVLSEENTISLDNFPYNWVPLIYFFDPDIPAFPLQRIHIKHNNERIFGIPVTKSVRQRHRDGTCQLDIEVMVNQNLEDVSEFSRNLFISELKERLGLSEALTLSDILNCCEFPDGTTSPKHENWKQLVRLIFPRLEEYYGNRIPCGRFFSKTYGIFRLVSTWNVPGGGKQEIIMTSNLLKTVGESIETRGGLRINLGLLPTYEEILSDELESFSKFRNLKNAVMDFGDRHLTFEYNISDDLIYYLRARARKES